MDWMIWRNCFRRNLIWINSGYFGELGDLDDLDELGDDFEKNFELGDLEKLMV